MKDLTMSGADETEYEAARGGGTGGGSEGVGRQDAIDGAYDLAANRITLCARPPLPPAVAEKCIVTVVATGTGQDGVVEVRGSQGVRVTGGPPPALPADSASVNGVEILVGATNDVTIRRGLMPTDQKVEMTPAGITVDAGTMPVTIRSLAGIELSVAGGTTRLKLGPEGVTIEAITIRLSATLQAQIQGVVNSISASGINKIGGPMTMIG